MCNSVSQIRVPQFFILLLMAEVIVKEHVKFRWAKAWLYQLCTLRCSEFESPGASAKELSECCKKDQDKVNSLYLKIDDKEYKYDNLTKYRTHTEPFKTTWPDQAIFGIEKGGNSTVVADGWYIITEPLAKGNHTIYFKSSLPPDPSGAEGYATDIKYNVIAE